MKDTQIKKKSLVSKICENIHLGSHLIEIYAYYVPWPNAKT